MEKLKDFPGALGADARNLAEIGNRGPLDLLQRAEMVEQRPFARGADAGDFLQAGLADALGPPLAVGADHEAMRLVAQPLDEIEHGVARLELDRLAVGHEQGLAAGVAIRSLGDRHQRYLSKSEVFEYLPYRVELAPAAVDDHEVGPLRHGVVGFFVFL